MAAITQHAYASKMVQLCHSFPCLRGKPGTLPFFDPMALNRWARVASHGERCAAQFVLRVWNFSHRWSCGKFDVMDAMSIWDPDNHKAFIQWACAPWWA